MYVNKFKYFKYIDTLSTLLLDLSFGKFTSTLNESILTSATKTAEKIVIQITQACVHTLPTINPNSRKTRSVEFFKIFYRRAGGANISKQSRYPTAYFMFYKRARTPTLSPYHPLPHKLPS